MFQMVTADWPVGGRMLIFDSDFSAIITEELTDE